LTIQEKKPRFSIAQQLWATKIHNIILPMLRKQAQNSLMLSYKIQKNGSFIQIK
jgi:hypothetical protein